MDTQGVPVVPRTIDSETLARESVLLVYPPSTSLWGCPPTALSALAPYLEENGYSVSLCDLNLSYYRMLLDRWSEFLPLIEERFVQRMEGPDCADATRRLNRHFLDVVLPLIGALRTTHRSSLLLERSVRVVSDDYFFEGALRDDRLASSLEELAATVDRCRSDPLAAALMDLVPSDRYLVVGFSLLSETQMPYAMLLADRLRRRGDTIVVGGAYATEVFEEFARDARTFDFFDFVVAHEGESALRAILETLQLGCPACVNHPNVAGATHVSRARFPGAHVVEDLDTLPQQDFSGFNPADYEPWGLTLPVYSSKGCTWGKCTFCSSRYDNRYRIRDVDRVVGGLVNSIGVTGATRLLFVDEDLPPARLRELAQGLILRGLDLPWALETRFHVGLDDELLGLLKGAGCDSLEFGLESASECVLQRIRKGIDLAVARRIVASCAANDLGVIVNCMIGFPFETLDDAMATVAFVDELFAAHPDARIKCNTQFVKLCKSSPLCEELGSQVDEAGLASPLSTTLSWERPGWLRQFAEDMRMHPLFTGMIPSQRRSLKMEPLDANPSDPLFALTPGLTHVGIEPVAGSTVHSYLVWEWGDLDAVWLNAAEGQVVSLLESRPQRLSGLVAEFVRLYPGRPVAESTRVLMGALMFLRDAGVLLFKEWRSGSLAESRSSAPGVGAVSA